MTAGNDFDPALDQPTLFSARVTPHRSLNPTGFLVLMIFIGAVSFVAGIAFLLMGAWPVIGFLGLDVLLVYWAFRVNYRAAAAYEESGLAHQLMERGALPEGNVAVLINAPERGLTDLP